MPRKTPLPQLRNIGIMAHIDAGKTTTTERILFYTGRVHRVGEVHDGAATMDWMEQEQERGITITSAATTAHWLRNDTDYRINIIDTPGHVGFHGRGRTVAARSRRCGGRFLCGGWCGASVRDGLAPGGPLHGAAHRFPSTRWTASALTSRTSVAMMNERLGANAHPVQYPLGEGELFTGVVDIVERKAIIYEDEMGSKFSEGQVPDGLKDQIEDLRHTLLEAAIEHDDELLEKYLAGEELSTDEFRHAIRAATIKGVLFPVFCGSAFKNKGVQALLDGVIDYLPSPVDVPSIQGHLPHHDETFESREASDDAPFAALAFKIATDPYVGKLTFFRVYSGSLPSGSYVYNATKDRRERVSRILQMHANKREERDEVFAGDIAAAIGLKQVKTRRHSVLRYPPDHLGGDELPGAGDRGRDRAED